MEAHAVETGTPAVAGRRRWVRAAGFAVAGVLIAIALLVLALRIVLAGMPERADRVKAWVERQTQLRLEFSSLDARLRWYGPELVLYDLRILDRAGRQPMLAMREGSVALDLWNVLRAGEFVAGRVSFVGPEVTVLRLEDGSVRLLGLGERPADKPLFDLDRLPAGHVQIADATVHLRDLTTRAGPWTVRDLDVVLRRDRDRVVARGSARLPESLGSRIGFEAELDGTLAEPRDLAGRVDLEAERLQLAGLASFLPRGVARPLAGTGRIDARIEFAARRLARLRLALDLRELTLRAPVRKLPAVEVLELGPPRRTPDSQPLSMPLVEKRWRAQPVTSPASVSYQLLAGRLDLSRVPQGWAFDLRDLRLARTGRPAAPVARVHGEFRGRAVTRHSLSLDAQALRLEDLWPLALALAPHAADRWLGLAPRGEIRALRLALERPRAGAIPEFKVSADVADLRVAASGRWPGLGGLTATVSGSDQAGRIELRAPALEFEWPAMFTAAPGPGALLGDIAWRRDGPVWTIGAKRLSLEHPQARAQGAFELRYEGRGQAPQLRADATFDQVEARLVRVLLPFGRLKPRSTAWLEPAFLHGTAVGGVAHFAGSLDRFPFRNGGGEIRIAFDARDVSLGYYPGFAPLTAGRGRVIIENGGLRAQLESGRVAGLTVDRGAVTIDDLQAPVVDVAASGRGNLENGLALLQKSPLGPVIGRQFMQLSGSGDTSFDVRLHLPTRDPEGRDYEVRAGLRQVSVSLPLLREPARDVSGELVVRRREIRSAGLHGHFLGGPFAITVAPGDPSAAELDSVVVEGSGRAAGPQLPAYIGLPAAIRMSGGLDWTLALASQRQQRGEAWPTQLEIASDLRGLAIDAPPPFAKAMDDARRTALTLDFAPGGATELDIRSGTAHARLALRDRDGKPQFERGALRFDDSPLSLPTGLGLQIDGDWPDFDLGRWLALSSDEPGRRRLSEWLGPVNVRLERARILGYELRDVEADLAASDRYWQVELTGPQAAGRVTVPFDFEHAPVELDMQRLHLESATTAPGVPPTRDKPTDPRRVPAITVAAEEFVWQGRRLGRVRAEILRDPQGLRLGKFTAAAPAFDITATGRWFAEATGSRSTIDVEATSTDLAAASAALGYRDAIDAQHARFTAHLSWPGGPSPDAVPSMDGRVHVELDDGQLRHVEPGAAGRVLGLMSVVELPRRLALDFRDVTDEGLAFDSVRGDFEVAQGQCLHTEPAASRYRRGHRCRRSHRAREPGLRPDRHRER